jgi:uncharacterized protein with HEPN domain
MDILDNIGRIEYFARGLDAKSFAGDDRVVFAVKYALIIVSEAAAPALSAFSPSRIFKPRP